MASKTQRVHVDAEKIDARLESERARLVALLRRLADRIEAAPVSRISDALAWVAGGVDMLVRAVDRALGREAKRPEP